MKGKRVVRFHRDKNTQRCGRADAGLRSSGKGLEASSRELEVKR